MPPCSLLHWNQRFYILIQVTSPTKDNLDSIIWQSGSRRREKWEDSLLLTHLTCFALSRCLPGQVPQPTCYFQKQVRRGTWSGVCPTSWTKLYSSNVAQGECERGTEWKIEWGKKGHSFELPNKALGKSVKDEFWIGVDIINCNSVFQLQGVFLTGTPLKITSFFW